jgi:DNA invertase Pin-like site-specific DNA recombinase
VRAITYTRVSTTEQAASGLGIAAQADQIAAEVDRRGWDVVEAVVDDGYSAKSLNRPGISHALDLLAAGDADALVAAKLDRVSRSLLDFAGLMERARNEGWALIVLDLGVDTSTPAGQLMANVLASFAEYERQLISQRTRDALAVAQSRGVRLGRPDQRSREEWIAVRNRIDQLRASGSTLQAIADDLNADDTPTRTPGAQWHRSTIRACLLSSGTAAA